MGVKFVTPKSGDSVAVVARSVEAKVEEEIDAAIEAAEEGAEEGAEPSVEDGATPESDAPEPVAESENVEPDATIEGDDTSQ